MTRTAAVIGAGIAGLSAAIALRNAGYRVRIFETAAELVPRGAALSLWANAISALRILGVADRIEREAAEIRMLGAKRADGAPILHVSMADAYSDEMPRPRLASRALLQAALLDGIGQSSAITCATVATGWGQDSECAWIDFSSGERIEADLLVAADGLKSHTATALLCNSPVSVGYAGIGGLSAAIPGVCDVGAALEYWGGGDRFGLFDLGLGRAYWFYIRAQADDVPLATRDDAIRAAARFPAGLVEAIDATRDIVSFDIRARTLPNQLGDRRIVCVGDAAHAMEPNLGQGGCQALEDAVALGVAARGEIGDLVGTFERLRLGRVRTFMQLSRQGGCVAQPRNSMARVAQRIAPIVPDWATARRVGSLHRLPDYAALAA